VPLEGGQPSSSQGVPMEAAPPSRSYGVPIEAAPPSRSYGVPIEAAPPSDGYGVPIEPTSGIHVVPTQTVPLLSGNTITDENGRGDQCALNPVPAVGRETAGTNRMCEGGACASPRCVPLPDATSGSAHAIALLAESFVGLVVPPSCLGDPPEDANVRDGCYSARFRARAVPRQPTHFPKHGQHSFIDTMSLLVGKLTSESAVSEV
jgi:hypothetical protein